MGSSENGCARRKAEHPNHVWAWDFIFDRTESGSPLKWLSIVDEYTRECLALPVGRGMDSEEVIETLRALFAERGVPEHIRSDNGPEFVARAIRRWLEALEIGPLYIEPGSPWENGYAESFHSRFRDEFLNVEVFEDLSSARRLSAAWREEYNHRRPHSSLGYQTPAEFGRSYGASASAAPSLQPPRSPESVSPFVQPLLS